MTAHAAPVHPGSSDAGPNGPSADELARHFSDRMAADMRYVAAWDRWMVYDGAAWRPDDTLRVLAAAREICRAAAETAGDARVRARLGSLAALDAVERMARLDPRHAATPTQWDADPFLLNTPGGTVDLRDGKLHPHRREDYLTCTTSVAPGGDCPRFLAVLARIFGGDAALVGFVQRALGHALAGLVVEPALFLACGPGASGKSLLLDTVVAVLGGYALVTSLDALAAPKHPPREMDRRLARARLVVATVGRTDRFWDEESIVALAGGALPGEPPALAARAGRGFKLFVTGNQPPVLRGVEPAMRRRLKVIPFGAAIPEGAADPDLPHTLQAEWPGILAWMIAGCSAWQRSGLAPPPTVAAASDDYFAQEDLLADWLAEFTRKERAHAETAGALYRSWCRYADALNVTGGSRKYFARALQARGFVSCRLGEASARGYKGIRLCDPEHDRETLEANYHKRIVADVLRMQAAPREKAPDAPDASVRPDLDALKALDDQ